jgi:hypothetical protein
MKLIDISRIFRIFAGFLLTSMVLSTTDCEAKQGITGFTDYNRPSRESAQINYGIDATRAKFFVYVPDNYSGRENFGLLVYTSPQDSITDLPAGWSDVLTKRKLIFVAAQAAGNNLGYRDRMGLGLRGAMGVMRQYKIDPNRVYAAGLSGGARTANDLAFYQSDLFHGTIQDCGCNYWRPVRKVAATSDKDTLGNSYGISEVSENDIARAKSAARFALITGPDDFRRGNILDIYNDGFARDGFQARLFDIPGMGHQDCNGETLEKVLNYLDTGR